MPAWAEGEFPPAYQNIDPNLGGSLSEYLGSLRQYFDRQQGNKVA
jgi:hypothetical protein